MTDRLEPCPTPWCEPEHEKYIWQGPDDLFCVICDGCQVEGPSCENEGDARDAWNNRATSNETPADAMELKPCPKCQINEAFVDKHRSYYAAECPRCGYWTEAFHTEAEAIAAWNTRTTSLAAQDGLVEAIEDLRHNYRAADAGGEFIIVSIYSVNTVLDALSAIKGDKS